MAKAIDLTGMKFGRLTVIDLNKEESSKPRGKNGRKIRYWNCLCECGNTHVVQAQKLKTGEVKSCGCFSKENSKQRAKENFIHEHIDLEGQSCHKEFHSWMGGTHVECSEQDYLDFKQMKINENTSEVASVF